MNVVMIGSGCLGFVSGASVADFGANVIFIDKDDSRINSLLKDE